MLEEIARPFLITITKWVKRPYSKSKLELNSKKSHSIKRCKFFSFVFLFSFFALKARLQVLKFEFCQINLV